MLKDHTSKYLLSEKNFFSCAVKMIFHETESALRVRAESEVEF